jgi:hypothetical protein
VIRRVAFSKAGWAGVAGALSWEALVRALILIGLPLFDIVGFLGSMVAGSGPPWMRWLVGLVLHASVGVVWAIFYAYFFWSTLDWRPAAQGLMFALLPIVLAGLIMLPQLGWMHPLVLGHQQPAPGLFARSMGWGGPAGVVLGHLAYGLVMGSIYTRPVGYRVPSKVPAYG